MRVLVETSDLENMYTEFPRKRKKIRVKHSARPMEKIKTPGFVKSWNVACPEPNYFGSFVSSIYELKG